MRVLIELNSKGIMSLLSSPEVQQMLDRKAHAVADAAARLAPTVDGDPGATKLPIIVDRRGNARRARARVVADHPSALAVEAKHRLLGGSLDAARD